MRDSVRDLLNGMLCAAVVMVCFLASHPFAEMGLIDDWSYIKTAQVFAQTGHFVYNGWATAMLGWQIPWAALFIKIFGFSFTVTRLAMLPFAAGAVALMYACSRRFGISSSGAAVGALTLGLSPLFLSLTATFMTDTGGLFFILLCLYCCLRAVDASAWQATIVWLCCAAISNAVGGSSRQIVWLGALVMVPSTGWYLRRRRNVAMTTASLWVLSFALIVAMMHWFHSQPYSLPEKLMEPVRAKSLAKFLMLWCGSLPYFSLLMLPVLITWLTRVCSFRRKDWLQLSSLLLGWAALCRFLLHSKYFDYMMMPWLKPMLYGLGMDKNDISLSGTRQVALGIGARAIIGMLVLSALFAFLKWLLQNRQAFTSNMGNRQAADWKAMFWTAGVFSGGYLVMLVPRALSGQLFDRYFLCLMPFGLFALLKLYEHSISTRLPVVCFIATGAFGFYAVAETHDWFAFKRAQVEIVNEVVAREVSVMEIGAGTEYDGWTQIDRGGYINDPRLAIPAGAYHAYPVFRSPCTSSGDEQTTNYTPIVHPKYVVTHSILPCYESTDFEPKSYHTWLPFTVQKLLVQRVPE